jgi:hypothetical protein
MSERSDLLASIANTTKDYRAGEIIAPTPEHVDRWLAQFAEDVHLPLLREIDHVLKKTYLTKDSVVGFLTNLVKSEQLAGEEPCTFWKGVRFLNIQRGGNSQREMLAMFASILERECGLKLEDCGKEPQNFLYLDDALFSGNRIKNDLRPWIKNDAPPEGRVHVVTIALHRGGQYYAKEGIEQMAREVNKRIELTWWRAVELEDTKLRTNSSDVLRPTTLSQDARVQAYVAGMRFKPVLRTPPSRGEHEFFSSEDGRALVEQTFLKAGVDIRDQCPYLNVYQRPLGNMVLETLGFGSMIVTFRNCPNNAPLALWAGDPWYPLFPRKIN